MSAKSIGATLRRCREASNLSVDAVAALLRQHGISKSSAKTIYGWENGISQPKPDVLLLLCKFYDIKDVLGEFGITTRSELALSQNASSNELSSAEMELVHAYRNATPEIRRIVDSALEPYRRPKQSEEAM